MKELEDFDINDTLDYSQIYEAIKRKKFSLDANCLLEIITDKFCSGIILGLPKNMDGTEGPRAQSTRAFARNFSTKSNLPITFWDERLTTVAAERSLLSADLSRKKRRQVIDSVAAVLILQNLLDRLKNMDRRAPENLRQLIEDKNGLLH